MKNTLITLGMAGAMAMVSLSASAQEDKKAAEARKDIAEAKVDLKEAKMDSAADYQKFRKAAEVNIKANQQKIAELKARKSSDTKEVRQEYDRKVLALEQRNNDLTKRIRNSDGTKSSAWTSFKREFNHDMDELGQAFKDLGKNNTK